MRGRPPACAIAPPPLNDATTTPATLPRLELGLRFGLGLALALLGLLVYLGGLGGQFVYDDHILIEGNRYCASLGAAVHAFFEPLWASDPQGEIPNAFWRPLTVVVLAITRDLAGLEPRAFHVVSLLLHLAATWAAWRLATRLLRCGTLGWLVAALFAVHPAHVESVAWASAVNDPLFALFAMLSLERYLAWRERGLRGVPWAAGVLLLLGLLAKEQALVVPLVALVIDRRALLVSGLGLRAKNGCSPRSKPLFHAQNRCSVLEFFALKRLTCAWIMDSDSPRFQWTCCERSPHIVTVNTSPRSFARP